MNPEQEAAIAAAKARLAAKSSGFTAEQQAALDAAKARKQAKAGAGPDGMTSAERIAAAKAGTLAVDPARAARQAEIDAQAEAEMRGRGTLDVVADNLFGRDDGVQSYGETIGQTLSDMGSAALAGAARGTADLAGMAGQGLPPVMAVNAANSLLGADIPNPVSGESLKAGMGHMTGGATDYRGETVAGRMAGTVGEFVPGAMALGGGGAMNLLKYAALPGVASETAGMATEGTALEPWARAGAAIAAPLAVNALGAGFTKLISPYGGADPERLKLAQVLDDAGVPLTAGQRVGSDALRRKEGLTGKGQAIAADQKEAFTSAALKTAGTDAQRATPEVMAATSKRIGDVFDDVLRGVDVAPTPQTAAQIDDALVAFKDAAPSGGAGPAVMAEMSARIAAAAETGQAIPASIVAGWRSRLSKMTTSSDAAIRESGRMAMEALDDALETTLVGLGRSDDVARLATARGQWRNFLAIQRAATSAGENAAAGLISPSALRSAVVQQGRSSYAQGGRGDLGALARAGEGVMKALPDSGTPGGLAARGLTPQNMLAAMGAGVGASSGNPYLAMAGALGGAALPAVAGAVRMSGPVQSYLANQVLGAAPSVFPRNALAPAVAITSGERNWLAGP